MFSQNFCFFHLAICHICLSFNEIEQIFVTGYFFWTKGCHLLNHQFYFITAHIGFIWCILTFSSHPFLILLSSYISVYITSTWCYLLSFLMFLLFTSVLFDAKSAGCSRYIEWFLSFCIRLIWCIYCRNHFCCHLFNVMYICCPSAIFSSS